MATIAGHTFVDKRGREVCEYCGMAWIDVAQARQTDIDQTGWAHSGRLTTHEYEQIDNERERRWDNGLGVTRKRAAALETEMQRADEPVPSGGSWVDHYL